MSSAGELERELRRQVESGAFTLPDPARGRTAERHNRLLEVGRADLQIARVAEAHTDAVSILHEAGRTEVAGALYGVWAAEDPSCQLELLPSERPSWSVRALRDQGVLHRWRRSSTAPS